MSVAFRRESEEEHLEPRFELPIPPGPNLVTPHGLAQIETRSANAEAVLAATEGEEARKAALREARYWRQRAGSAELALVPDGSKVAIGTTVTFRRGETTRTLTIVGHDEADPNAGKVAFTAPLVRPLMGAAVGDEIEDGEEWAEVVRIEL